jgi:hypothetical protein
MDKINNLRFDKGAQILEFYHGAMMEVKRFMSSTANELRAKLAALYAQEAEADPIVYAKFFLPGTAWTWYVPEGSPQENDFLFFGFVVGLESEQVGSTIGGPVGVSTLWPFDSAIY